MNKKQFRLAIALGLTLGAMALLLFSFYISAKEITYSKKLDAQIKHDLIQDIKGVCHPDYPEVQAAIYRGKIVVKCNTGE